MISKFYCSVMSFIFFRSALVDFSSYLLLSILIDPNPAKVLSLFPFYSCCTKFPALLCLIALMTVSVDLVLPFQDRKHGWAWHCIQKLGIF
jgi:hypothetical protein